GKKRSPASNQEHLYACRQEITHQENAKEQSWQQPTCKRRGSVGSLRWTGTGHSPRAQPSTKLANRSCTRRWSYRSTAIALPFLPISNRSYGSLTNRRTASVRATALPGGTISPEIPFTTASRHPRISVATTGRAAAIASRIDLGKPSRYEARTKISIAPRQSATRSVMPVNTKRPDRPESQTICRKVWPN